RVHAADAWRIGRRDDRHGRCACLPAGTGAPSRARCPRGRRHVARRSERHTRVPARRRRREHGAGHARQRQRQPVARLCLQHVCRASRRPCQRRLPHPAVPTAAWAARLAGDAAHPARRADRRRGARLAAALPVERDQDVGRRRTVGEPRPRLLPSRDRDGRRRVRPRRQSHRRIRRACLHPRRLRVLTHSPAMPPESARPTASRTAVVMLMLVMAAAAVRLVVLPVNQHLYGDAVARTEMAEQWARAPHLITSFADGAAQFGPLHLYLIAAALELVDRDDASRIVSFVFGVLTVLPLYAVTRRYFDGRAAVWACLGFALWGLHIQASTTGGSEAVALCLMWIAFAAFARGLDDRRILSF